MQELGLEVGTEKRSAAGRCLPRRTPRWEPRWEIRLVEVMSDVSLKSCWTATWTHVGARLIAANDDILSEKR